MTAPLIIRLACFLGLLAPISGCVGQVKQAGANRERDSGSITAPIAGGSDSAVVGAAEGRAAAADPMDAADASVLPSAPPGLPLAPAPPTADSPWGTYVTDLGDPQQIARVADYGNSWGRLNFFEADFENLTVVKDSVSADFVRTLATTAALKARGMFVMGEIFQIPRQLSSRPDDTGTSSEGSPGWARRKPGNYAAWEALMQHLARTFAGKIDTWELWNEGDASDFWLGTAAELAELMQHTIAGLRAGNPSCKVVCGSFTGDAGEKWFDDFFAAGGANRCDAISLHNDLSARASTLSRHGLSAMPIWATEAHALLPLEELSVGAAKVFHFLDRQFSSAYAQFPCLMDVEFKPTRSGVTYAVAASLIGKGVFVSKQVGTAGAYIFDRTSEGKGLVLAVQPRALGYTNGSITLDVAALRGSTLQRLSADGTATPVTEENGHVVLPIDAARGAFFLNHAATMTIAAMTMPTNPLAVPQTIYPFLKGTASAGWESAEAGVSAYPNGDRHMYKTESGDYWLKVSFDTSAGDYQLLLLGVTPQSVVAGWSSPYSWQIDGEAVTKVTTALPCLWRVSTESEQENAPVTSVQFTAGPELYQVLASRVSLSAGRHDFTLRLIAPRPLDMHYISFFEGIVLRPLDK